MDTEHGIHTVTCKRCGHRWATRKKKPVRCASAACRSPYWNRKPGGDEPEPEALTRAEFMAELLEGETDSFEATQTVDFGEGPKVFEAWSITDGETAKAYLKSYVAIYRRQAAERQCIQAGSVENWYSSMTPELSQEWADMKKSLLGWEKQAKEQEDYWKRVKQMEQPAAPLAPVTPPVTEAQRIADVQKAIDSDRQRTARLTGIML